MRDSCLFPTVFINVNNRNFLKVNSTTSVNFKNLCTGVQICVNVSINFIISFLVGIFQLYLSCPFLLGFEVSSVFLLTFPCKTCTHFVKYDRSPGPHLSISVLKQQTSHYPFTLIVKTDSGPQSTVEEVKIFIRFLHNNRKETDTETQFLHTFLVCK